MTNQTHKTPREDAAKKRLGVARGILIGFLVLLAILLGVLAGLAALISSLLGQLPLSRIDRAETHAATFREGAVILLGSAILSGILGWVVHRLRVRAK